NQGGRPSDEVVIVDVPIALERQGSPVSLALQPTQKKGRSVEELMMVEDTPIEAMQDASGQTSGSTPGAGGVVMVDFGSENVCLGMSARSPHKRDIVDKGRVVDRHKESMLHVWGSASEEGVGMIQEGTMRQQGVVASQGKLVLAKTSLEARSYGWLVFECLTNNSPRLVAISEMVNNNMQLGLESGSGPLIVGCVGASGCDFTTGISYWKRYPGMWLG
ncbi:hypothetical protein V6N11_058833, partial [Hibiscus sabdariffa]